MYGHPIYFLETFVDPERFRGTCYRAANWVLLGKTTGRGAGRKLSRPSSPAPMHGYRGLPRFIDRLNSQFGSPKVASRTA